MTVPSLDRSVRRRTLVRRLAAAGGLTVGIGGVASADQELYVNWRREDGRVERIPAAAFERRADTPSLDAVDAEAASPPCCGVLDPEEFPLCVEC